MVSEVTNTTQEIVEAILTGEVDDGHEQIRSAIRHRADAMARILAAGLEPGDRVRLVRIKPKYLAGATATVVSRPEGERVELSIDDGEFVGRFNGEVVRAHISSVERIEEVA